MADITLGNTDALIDVEGGAGSTTAIWYPQNPGGGRVGLIIISSSGVPSPVAVYAGSSDGTYQIITTDIDGKTLNAKGVFRVPLAPRIKVVLAPDAETATSVRVYE